jgi:hypothetical protein
MKDLLAYFVTAVLAIILVWGWLGPNVKFTLKFPFLRRLGEGEPQIKKRYVVAVVVVILIGLSLSIWGLWRSRKASTAKGSVLSIDNDLKEK